MGAAGKAGLESDLERRLRKEARGRVLFDAASRGRYATDASIYQIMPLGVFVPEDEDDARIALYAALMNAGRVVVNTPSAQGAVGGTFNTLPPSFTLGCGAGGKNITTENVTARHLINVKRCCRRRTNERLARFDTSRYLDESLDFDALSAQFNRNY